MFGNVSPVDTAHVYVRISQEDQSEHSLTTQEESCRALCKAKGWTNVRVYIEDGKSAKDLNRPRLREMRRNVKRGDAIVVWKLDRLTRSAKDAYALVDEWIEIGVSAYSAMEGMEFAGQMGRMYLGLLAIMAEWERANIRVRVFAGQQKRAQTGKFTGGVAPYGYDLHESGRLEPNHRADVVADLFDQFLQGETIRGLYRNLTGQHVPSPGGKSWSLSTILRILRNPAYYGAVQWGLRGTGGTLTKRQKQDNPLLIEDAHVPIVSRSTWQAVQARLDQNAKLPWRTAGPSPYPLTGTLRCAVCGAPMGGERNTKSGYMRYRCSNRRKGGDCNMKMHPANAVHQAFLQAVAAHANPDYIRAAYADVLDPAQRAESQRASLLQEQRELAGELERWDKAYRKNSITEQEWERDRRPMNQRLGAIEDELLQLEAEPIVIPVEEIAGQHQAFRAAWDAAQVHEQKALARSFFTAAIVHPDGTVTVIPVSLTGPDHDTAAD